MEVTDCSRLEFPVFIYSTKGGYFYSQRKEDFGYVSRLGLQALQSEDLNIIDSKGRHFRFLKVKYKKMLISGLISLIFFNPRYKAKFIFTNEYELNLESFKRKILGIIDLNGRTLESSGDPDEIMQQVENTESYREIIEMFL